ncbi:hypothetical protein DXA94_03860 [Agathobaculum butyriciproducens]|nr:hypothetical protein DXA94_03860 [Agathobaculum butyriciproducens]
MGSRIQHIAFIVFALLFVAIIAVINTGILNMGTNANKTLSTTVQTSNSSTLELYNNTKIAGDTVANAAKNPDSLANTSMTVFVATKASTTPRRIPTARSTRRNLPTLHTLTLLHNLILICARTITVWFLAFCLFRKVLNIQ